MEKLNEKKLLTLFLVVLIFTGTLSLRAQFDGGEGTEDNPWQIATAQHLHNIRNYLGEEHSDKHYVQTANIDLGTPPWNEDTGWQPIGLNINASFQGSYNGAGYVIENLTINRPTGDNQALFGFTVSATIKNLGLHDVNITGRTTVAGIAANQRNGTRIETSYVTGYISGYDIHGGNIGGISGQMLGEDSSITNSYSAARIRMFSQEFGMVPDPLAAGIVGAHSGGQIRHCFVTGNIKHYGQSRRVAALIGGSTETESLSDLYWDSETTGQTHGIAQTMLFPGSSTLQMVRQETYEDFDFENVWQIIDGFSYPWLQWREGPDKHNIPAPRNLQGIGGAGNVSLTWQAPVMDTEPLGYLIYRDDLQITEEPVTRTQYQDRELTNWQYYNYYVTALYNAGESSPSEAISVSPVAFAGGTGTVQDPYLIETAEHLNGVRYAVNDYFRQTADIDIGVPPWNENEGWIPIGTGNEHFSGTYNGNYYTISGLTIDRESIRQGLFGAVSNARLQNMVLKNVNVKGTASTGGLAGYSQDSNISNCSVDGYVAGTTSVGGLVGDSRGESVISRCFSNGMVASVNTTSSPVGGLVGVQRNNSSIIDSYSTAVVSGSERRVAGLLGANYQHGTVLRCYAAGWIKVISPADNIGGLIGQNWDDDEVVNSYWNTDSSRLRESNGGTGLSTQAMLSRESFLQWNFDNVWSIDEGTTYPYLTWQEDYAGNNRVAPHNLNATPDFTAQTIRLTWQTRDAPVSYNIYRNREHVGSVNHPVNEWIDNDTNTYERYTYFVTAVFAREDEELETSLSNGVNSIIVSPYAGGSGTPDDPYQVETTVQLDNIRYLLNSNFIQVANIDLDVPPWNEDEGWIPIGTNDVWNRFTGTYDGDEHVISNIFIDRTDSYQGLFGSVKDAELQNIILEDVDITGVHYTGSLAGYIHSSIVINCSSSGTVSGRGAYTGGITGVTRFGNTETNIIKGCHSSAVINGQNYVGGLVGESFDGIITECWATGNVTGLMYSGGLVGYVRGELANSYARGNVQGTRFVGGLTGRNTGSIDRNYSTGEVTAESDGGGLIGLDAGQVTNSYWDIETSNREISSGGFGRLTRQMVYPYDNETFVNWDFDEIWVHDNYRIVNNGYPFSSYHQIIPQSHPNTATDPHPQHRSTNIPAATDTLHWEYHVNQFFTNPVGFRVYFNTTGDFADDDDFAWVNYQEGQERYSTSEIVPELDYRTDYYWKVVPTTIAPDERSDGRQRRQNVKSLKRQKYGQNSALSPYRGDAQNVPVWSFRTEIIPYPTTPTNPIPADEATDIPVDIDEIGWTYTPDENYTNPVGFRVYMNTTGDFNEDDVFVWVTYRLNQFNYTNSSVLPDSIAYNQTYYWKVVPTTIHPDDDGRRGRYHSPDKELRGYRGQAPRPVQQTAGPLSKTSEPPARTTDRRAVILETSEPPVQAQGQAVVQDRGDNRQRRLQLLAALRSRMSVRGDADSIAVWSFTTIETEPFPQTATNPNPEHLATDIPLDLENVSWDYLPSEIHADPVGFRVYMNTTGQFGANAPYDWIDYQEGQVRYKSTEIIPLVLDPQTTYYWRVVPTTIHPDDGHRDRQRPSPLLKHRGRLLYRGDAQGSPTWRFMTAASTNVEANDSVPYTTELYGNYPNPFNPNTYFSFALASDGWVEIELFNSRGQKINSAVEGFYPKGEYRIEWNGIDNRGVTLSSGVYYYRFSVDGKAIQTRKMILMK